MPLREGAEFPDRLIAPHVIDGGGQYHDTIAAGLRSLDWFVAFSSQVAVLSTGAARNIPDANYIS